MKAHEALWLFLYLLFEWLLIHAADESQTYAVEPAYAPEPTMVPSLEDQVAEVEGLRRELHAQLVDAAAQGILLGAPPRQGQA